MIAAEVDRFYRSVVRDFISNIHSSETLVRDLEQQGLYLPQIEEKMLEKLNDSAELFRRLTLGYNEIEKEMMSRYATVEEIDYNQRKIRISSGQRSSNNPSIASESLNDDLECYSQMDSKPISERPQAAEEDRSQNEANAHSERSRSVSSNRRRPSSEFSQEDLSDFDAEYGDAMKRLRENAKIHILGTYDCGSKKHDFKHDLTEITLDNVFIKVEGVAKEIVLKKLHVVSRKRAHH